MITFLKSIKLWAYAILAAIGAGLLGWLRWDAKNDAKQKAKGDAYDKVQKGNDYVADNRGDDPADRLRRNEGKW